jgi:hypothetical protein
MVGDALRAVSADFIQAEAAAIQTPDVQAIVRPNPEALAWSQKYTGTGKTGTHGAGAGAAYGWYGLDYPDGDYPVGSCCVTSAGWMVRTYAVSTVFDAAGPIYVNRVGPASGNIQTDLSAWTKLTTSAVLNVTREAISEAGGTLRLFYIRLSDQKLVYRQSTDNAATFGAEVVVSSTVWGVCSLSSPHPDYVFVCARKGAAGVNGDPSATWLELTAYQLSSGTWYTTKQPKPPTRQLNNRANNFWDGAFQFDSAMLDATKGIACVVMLDDLAGRPASVVYQNRTFSDYFPVEAIDFADPERDDVIGYRCSKIGNKIVLAAKRSSADSDFSTTKDAVLYYSVDGAHWSADYLITEAGGTGQYTKNSPYNWGTPVMRGSEIWLVGMDSVWVAPITPLFGGASPAALELDVTPALLDAATDEPSERLNPTTATATLDNMLRQWNGHPLMEQNCELEIRGGYKPYSVPATVGQWAQTERVPLFIGRIDQPVPSAVFEGDTTVKLSASDYLANLKEGELDRALVYPNPLRSATLFNTATDLDLFAVIQGSWEWQSAGGNKYARATGSPFNYLLRGTGEPGGVSFSARIRVDNPFNATQNLEGSVYTTSTVALMFGVAPDLRTYYAVKCGAGVNHFELWKVRPNTNGTINSRMLVRSSVTGPDVPVNRWFRLGITQQQQRIQVFLQWEDDQNSTMLIDFNDVSPINEYGSVTIRAGLAAPKPASDVVEQRFQSVFVDDIRILNHDVETSMEDFLAGVAYQRGFDTVVADALVSEAPGSAWSNWTAIGSAGAWTTDAAGLHYNGSTRPLGTLWALRHSTQLLSNLIADVEWTINPAKTGTLFNNTQEMGMYLRGDGTANNCITLNIHSGWDGTANALQTTQIAIQVYEAGSMTHYQYMTSLVPLWPGWRQRVRFVVNGPWYSVYINGCFAGAFYETRRSGITGSWGFANNKGGFDSPDLVIHSLRVPWLDFGDIPFVQAGAKLDDVMTSVLSSQHGWLRAVGRTLYMGKALKQTVDLTVTDATWLSGGFQQAPDLRATHCRCISKDADGNEISGSAWSPTLRKKIGRSRWKLISVDGLRTERECRDRAWQWLIDQERAARSRSYDMHPQLRLERFDLLTVYNSLDDTAEKLYLTGMARNWTRDRNTGNVVLTMQARLEEWDAERLARATTFAPQ